MEKEKFLVGYRKLIALGIGVIAILVGEAFKLNTQNVLLLISAYLTGQSVIDFKEGEKLIKKPTRKK